MFRSQLFSVVRFTVGLSFFDDRHSDRRFNPRKAGKTFLLLATVFLLLATTSMWAVAQTSDGTVVFEQKISDTAGGFGGVLEDLNFFGFSVANIGDVDGDGVQDLAVGAPLDNDGGFFIGAVWILFLNADGSVKAEQKISDTTGGFGGVLDDGDDFGVSVASIGDLDGDGVQDLAVGADGDDDGGFERGAVWILFLNADGTVKAEQKISDTEGGLGGVLDNGDFFGVSVASIGDLDGDGVRDLAVGAPTDDDGGFGRGAVWILFLNADGTVKAEQKISETEGGFGGVLDDSDFFGASATSIGDLDGDGVRDLAVGAPFDDDGGLERGAVWILFLNADGTVKAEQKISETTGGLESLDDGDNFGLSVAGIGDLDGDGVQDLAAGAPFDDDGGPERGAVWILFLNADGTVKAEQKISQTTGGFGGVLIDLNFFGISVANIGDLDGDGVIDLAVGAAGDDDGGLARGAVWILFLRNLFVPPSFSGDGDGGGGGCSLANSPVTLAASILNILFALLPALIVGIAALRRMKTNDR